MQQSHVSKLQRKSVALGRISGQVHSNENTGGIRRAHHTIRNGVFLQLPLVQKLQWYQVRSAVRSKQWKHHHAQFLRLSGLTFHHIVDPESYSPRKFTGDEDVAV